MTTTTRRVAIVDVGTNSTRLLIADVAPGGRLSELDRRTTVTRLGAGVDHTGLLQPEAMERVLTTVAGYRDAIDAHAATRAVAVMTSAVRDARNGAELANALQTRYGLEPHILGGDEEAELTYRGATSERADDGRRLVVIDIGGGSTELVVGTGATVEQHASTQAGVVRQTERFVHTDPPAPEELQQLAAEARTIFQSALPETVRSSVQAGIAVAGTPTSCAAILQELDPYDSAKVHGYELLRAQVEMLLARLADMPLERRRQVKGLHPDRASVIVTGVLLLLEAMRACDLDAVTVSEHDILRGAALKFSDDAAGRARAEDLARPAG
jgi:exopolyphosphatase/guanosine-5'-triphosphate,3'-diphosphate pyrophosphatase